MKKKITVLLPGMLLCLWSANALAQENLINNGGFENPALSFYATYTAPASFSGWTVGTGSVDIVTTNLYAAASGRQSVDLNATISGSIFQNVATTPGQVYRLTFQFAANPLPDNPCCPAPVLKQMNVL